MRLNDKDYRTAYLGQSARVGVLRPAGVENNHYVEPGTQISQHAPERLRLEDSLRSFGRRTAPEESRMQRCRDQNIIEDAVRHDDVGDPELDMCTRGSEVAVDENHRIPQSASSIGDAASCEPADLPLVGSGHEHG
ncbi:hypothetical protein ACQGAO_18425 [Rhodococcus sp. 1.20]